MSLTYLKKRNKWEVRFYKNGETIRVGYFDTEEEAKLINSAYKNGDSNHIKKYSQEWYAAESKRQLAELPQKYTNSKALKY